MNFKYRLGLDLGATSIGWAVYNIDKDKIENFGVRIFDDGREDKSKASLCVKRREVRGLRRLQNRKHIQKQELIKTLESYDMLPSDPQSRQEMKLWDVYELRAKALDEKISLWALARILFQLVQRKGFLSNRKSNKEEGGKLKKGYEELKADMVKLNARTYGEYLYKKRTENLQAKLRLKGLIDPNSGKYLGGAFPYREIYKKEFETIYNKQKEYYPDVLTSEWYEKFKDILFFQRPLKEAEEGECTFEVGEKRIAKAHPLFQEFRFWQHILDLKFWAENDDEYKGLSKENIIKLVEILKNPDKYVATKKPLLQYTQIKKDLKLGNGIFNFEKKVNILDKEQTKGILADKTEYAMAQSQILKPYWKALNTQQKGQLINLLSRPSEFIDFPKTKISQELQDSLIRDYIKQTFGFPSDAVDELLYNVDLEEGFASLSEKALTKILENMKEGMQYSDACEAAGYKYSQKEYQTCEELPYYGKILIHSCLGQKDNPQIDEDYGKINNATVHIALNQVRHLVNEIIHTYGKPADISIEYARDLPASTEERHKMTFIRDSNEQENEKIRQDLIKKTGYQNPSKRDVEKYKIWKNMGIPKGENALNCRECPFTGEKISVSDLMNGERFQIEHLIPYSRSLDDSIHNKVIASVYANREKGNRTPYEAFHEDVERWAQIKSRARKLSAEQQWRFEKGAMKKFEAKESPIARSLNDTKYMTRILQDYLRPIVREDGKKTAQSVAGQLTSMVRKAWNLNLYKGDKEAEDYRAFHNHHAIDAIIIACINRSQIERTSHALKLVDGDIRKYFEGEFYKLKDETVSSEDKKALRKRIKDFAKERKEAIIQEYIQPPESLFVPDLIQRVKQINISHKPKLKNIKDLHSTIGQLHEDTAYGFKNFVDDESLMADFKTGNGKNKKIITKKVTDYIPIFYNSKDKKTYYDAYKAWFIVEGRSKKSNENIIKKQLKIKEKEAVLALKGASRKAFKWFVGGNNFCAEIYQINPQDKIGGVISKEAGEWKSEIISNYNATIRTRRKEEYFYWKLRYPNAKRIMTLKRNDMVMATFTKEQAFGPDFPKGIQEYVRNRFNENPDLSVTNVLFRVKKMNQDGRICFTPHDIAKEDGDSRSLLAPASTLQRFNVHKVFVSPMGRIKNGQ